VISSSIEKHRVALKHREAHVRWTVVQDAQERGCRRGEATKGDAEDDDARVAGGVTARRQRGGARGAAGVGKKIKSRRHDGMVFSLESFLQKSCMSI